MKIRTKLYIGAGIPILLIGLLTLSIYWLSAQVERELNRADMADQFARTTAEFHILLDQYLAYQEPNAEERLVAKLDSLIAQQEEAEAFIPLEILSIAIKSLSNMVPDLISVYEERADLLATNAPAEALERNLYLEDLFAALIRTDVQKITATAFTLTKEARTEATRLQHRTNQTTFGLSLLLILLLGSSALLIGRSVGGSLAQLTQGVEAIMAGDSGRRMAVRRNDEIGYLSETFNRLVDQQQETLSKLSHSESRYRTLVETSHDLIWEVDAQGVITFMNPVAKEIYGYEPEEMLGWNFGQLMDPEDLDAAMQVFQDALISGQETFYYENRVRNKAGEVVILDAHSVVRRDETGAIAGTMGTSQNITERRRFENALRENQQFLESVIACSPVALFSLDSEGKVKIWNDSAEKIFGWSAQEVVGQPLPTVPPAYQAEFTALRQRVMSGQRLEGMALMHQRKGGEYFDASLSSAPIFDVADNIIGIIAALEDVTERTQAERSLRQSEERFAKVFHANPVAISITEMENGRFVEVNQSYLTLSGFTRQEIIGLSASDLGLWRSPGARQRLINRLQASSTGTLIEEEMDFRTRTGEERQVLASHVLIQLNGRPHITFIAVDVTQRVRAQAELVQRKEDLQQLTIRLAEIEDRERQRLARELHDQVGQSLALLSFKLNMVHAQIGDPTATAAANQADLDDALSLVTETTQGIRSVMDDLRPSVLDDYGLLAALNWYGDRFAGRTGIPVQVEGSDLVSRLSPTTEITLFRVVQEALTNVARHAKASKVYLSLHETAGQITMQIVDNGIGIKQRSSTVQQERRGWGLVNMRERVEMLGGAFTIGPNTGPNTDANTDANTDRGTRIHINLARETEDGNQNPVGG